jgi:hypothetical protein
MANLNYWDGSSWVAIGTGGPQGPAGVDGQGIEVFGPQPAAPTPTRKGDEWLVTGAARSADASAIVEPSPITLEPITVQLLPKSPETVFVRFLPDPQPIAVQYLP